MNISSKIIATGSYLPERILTNHDIAKIVDTSDEWISERSGIKQRHIAAENEFTSDLAYKAAVMALNNANLEVDALDAIIVATTTADNIFPATATKVQHKLGLKKAFAFDVQAVCSGFVYALDIADKYIKSGSCKNILVVGAETISRILNWQDRNSCVLFGDGAGAVILTANNDSISGIIDAELHSDGQFYEILKTNGGPSLNNEKSYITMQGKEVFKQAVSKMVETVENIVKRNNLELADIKLVIPHQANQRILNSVAKRLKLNNDIVFSTVSKHANTSAASIPLALHEAVQRGVISRGDYMVFEALGAGLTWGSILLRW
jgi:3-oxoacyl-[acyl-carrier-protein] synthase-3